jgi:putative molybdopterin biosynthesis protein
MEKDTALTTQEVANMLKIAKNTVYELIKRGELNSYKVGRKVRIQLSDVEAYIAESKSIKESPKNESVYSKQTQMLYSSVQPALDLQGKGMVICGQDMMLDILSNYIQQHSKGMPALRSYIGSYNSLIELYQGNVQVASSHLWDGDTGQYNIPYVRRLLPGIPTVIVHLTYRMQGFYVAKGNPKGIHTWSDLGRKNIRLINREKGAGSRVLLDEHLRLLGIQGSTVKGYERESHSHLTVASTVGRGGADVGVGHEKVASQIDSIDFVPLQKERYELVIKKEDMALPAVQAILEILRSDQFKMEFENIGGYDIHEMGTIVAEI